VENIQFPKGQYQLMESFLNQLSRVLVRQQVLQLQLAVIKSSAKFLILSQLAERVVVEVLCILKTIGNHLLKTMEIIQDIMVLMMIVILLE